MGMQRMMQFSIHFIGYLDPPKNYWRDYYYLNDFSTIISFIVFGKK